MAHLGGRGWLRDVADEMEDKDRGVQTEELNRRVLMVRVFFLILLVIFTLLLSG